MKTNIQNQKPATQKVKGQVLREGPGMVLVRPPKRDRRYRQGV